MSAFMVCMGLAIYLLVDGQLAEAGLVFVLGFFMIGFAL